MEVLQIFGLCDQEVDSWFTNHKPVIPALNINSYKLEKTCRSSSK